MKIDPDRIHSVGQPAPSDQARANAADRAARRRAEAVGQDEARLLVDGSKLASLKAKLAKLPEVRQERVAELRRAVREGRYQVGNDQIAEAILQELTSGFLCCIVQHMPPGFTGSFAARLDALARVAVREASQASHRMCST